MDRETIIEQLAEDILAYVMSGTISESTLTAGLRQTGLDERFEDYELLLDLHFILKPDVTEFIQALPDRLRSIRTETQSVDRIQRGAINGRINWAETTKTRYSEAPRDRSLFVVENRSVDYDIPENIVLIQLLGRIHETLLAAEDILDSKYDWVTRTWETDKDLVERLKTIVERNVHVRRIRKPEAGEPTARMLSRAAEAREPIYREAAKLVEYRRNIHQGDSEALEELLSETTITPASENRLFELYVLFRFIGAIETARGEPLSVSMIRSDRDAIVQLKDEYELNVYYDQSGPDDIRFETKFDRPESEFSRFEDVYYRAGTVADAFFRTESSERTKRPDIFAMRSGTGGTEPEYFVVEVKNSASEGTIRRGIKETLEYLAFLKREGEFVFDDCSYYGNGSQGVLVVQDLEKETLQFCEQKDLPIRILQASELETKLPTLLDEWLSIGGKK